VGCHPSGMSPQWDVTLVGSHPGGMSPQGDVPPRWDVTLVGCDLGWMSPQWAVTPVGCHPGGLSLWLGCPPGGLSPQWAVTPVGCLSEWDVTLGGLSPLVGCHPGGLSPRVGCPPAGMSPRIDCHPGCDVTPVGCHPALAVTLGGLFPPGVRVSPAVPADSEYTEAEALIVTYSLNNFPRDDPRHEWVLSWESRFLEVVGDFQRTHSPNLSVAFMAEVRHPPSGVGGTRGSPATPSPGSVPAALAGGRDQPHHGGRHPRLRRQLPGGLCLHRPGAGRVHGLAPRPGRRRGGSGTGGHPGVPRWVLSGGFVPPRRRWSRR